jgi:hypothetical protein
MSYPFYDPTIHGDVLSRINLFRFIREHLYHGGAKKGYYLEFGVLNGDSLWDAYQTMRGIASHYYGFDSFQGLPKLSKEDNDGKHLMPFWNEGTVRGGTISRVQEMLLARSIPSNQLTLIPGFYEDTLKTVDPKELFKDKGDCHVCLIDCDLYSSSKTVFEWIEPILTNGTWLLLDDYWCYRGSPGHGQRKAFHEWIDQSELIGVSEWGNFRGWGKAFIVYEK